MEMNVDRNYVQEKGLEIRYELWDRGYRVNTQNFSEAKFAEILNLANMFDDGIEVTFDTLFNLIREQYPEWLINEYEEEQQYRAENLPKIREFFDSHFYGKSWNEISGDPELYEAWSEYSDWHKDVFGYRPHGIVCGEYINPHVEHPKYVTDPWG